MLNSQWPPERLLPKLAFVPLKFQLIYTLTRMHAHRKLAYSKREPFFTQILRINYEVFVISNAAIALILLVIAS